jgi:hypothetical protein
MSQVNPVVRHALSRGRCYSRLRDVGDIAAIEVLENLMDQLSVFAIERDILVCAALYLEGDKQPGGTVERWWKRQGAAT